MEEGKDRGNVILSLGSDKINTDLKIRLQEEGATIQARYPDGTTILSIPKNKIDLFKRTLKKSVQSFDTRQKISKGINLSQDVDIAINFNREISKEELENLINDFGLSQTKLSPNKTLLESKVDGFLIEGLASLPFITFINEQIDEPLPLGENSTSFHNVAHVKSNSFDGLSGEGVVVGVGDGGKLGNHIDFNGRIINEAFSWNSNYGSHGDNVTGIIGGNGNIHEKYEGLANKANIVIQQTHYVFYYLDEYYKKYGMNITNNSYGTSFSCGTGGKYEYYSWYMDEQTNKYEDVLHVVAAGNSGGSNCSPYPAGYNTVLRSYAAGKNTLTVGAVNMNRTKAASSSAGPTLDGRIKPEITSLGQKLITTGRNYNYGGFSATSGA
ncbi:MAG: S8 family serine peptidase, partial [Saprospiraceae bacterium]